MAVVKKMHKLSIIISVLVIYLMVPASLYSNGQNESPHGDRSKLPRGCASCHRGHGVHGTSMLPETKELFCFRCHGDDQKVEKTKQQGDLSKDANPVKIQKEFEKPYRHPIENQGIHRYGEILPEIDPSMPRHVACGDCHHHHYVTIEKKMNGIRGTGSHAEKVESINYEYELCFNCHSYSANLPADQTNKAEIFSISNPSFHPVVAAGRNDYVPSLIFPLTASSLIKCTDCHNNDDPHGPRCPLGSSYRYILAKNFLRNDGPEGTTQYELCYSCHSRSSILHNESFQFHDLHINTKQTSCRTCHNPHGSTRYAHLIDFDYANVSPSSSGLIEFRDLGHLAGQCYLNCHGKDHDPAVYPTTTTITPSSLSPSLYPIFRH